ncbi:MoaD/ThiS family protein [Mobilicoccus caccae]|uniref:MoaD family protein n=1 Tax=Mobilicoccus caccae TaxID=1859295 RepID=A0ABQ6IXQ8_9MICO|nr:MoaD/ThiS family protein [Mobilicoccus caccae]GMA41474.1 MoaD family protein [Mobilicoccus caccae]
MSSEKPVHVVVPTPLRRLTAGVGRVTLAVPEEVTAEGATLETALLAVDRHHPGFRDAIATPAGEPMPFVQLFVGGTNVRRSGGLATAVSPGDEIRVMSAVAGG